MTIEAQQIAQRFASLSPEARRRFFDKLADSGIDSTSLPIVPVARDADLPLSLAQRSLWLTWQREPTSAAYTLGGLLTFDAVLDVPCLRAALGDLASRHEPLRTVFYLDETGEPRQRIRDAASPALVVRDFGGQAEALSEAAVRALVAQPFDLETGPLLRLELHQMGADADRLAIVFHHIIADGPSIGMMIDELSIRYAGRRSGRPAEVERLAVQFADYAAWQRLWMEAGKEDRQSAFWQKTLGTTHLPLALPLDRARAPSRGSVEGGGHAVTLPSAVGADLRALAHRQGASVFMAVLALLKLLLARHTGEDDIRVGSPLSNRRHADTQAMIGYLSNMVVLRTVVDQTRSFADLLSAVRDGLFEAADHADLPFDAVVEALRPPRSPGLQPLFQVKCTEQEDRRADTRFAGLRVEARSLDAGEAHFDLSLDVTPGADGISCFFAYATDIFDPATIERLAADLVALAAACVADPTRALATIALPSASAASGPAVGRSEPAPDPVAAWRHSVEAQPDAIALVQNDRRFTRLVLDRASDRLAGLLSKAGVGPETRVALLMSRSPEWILALLAVLKAGGAYVPLDPAMPRRRRADLLADSGAALLLTDAATENDLAPDAIAVSFEDDGAAAGTAVPANATAGQPAYVMYTSGSTGRPKGVVVTRGGLADYVHGVLDVLRLPQGSRLAMVSTVAADLGNTVLFGALCGGGELHLIDAASAFDPDRFADTMAEGRIDALKITPSHLEALLQARHPARVLPGRVLILGGEATGWNLVDRVGALAPTCRVLNHYGPTETTVGAVCQPAEDADRAAAALPIGRPLASSTTQVLDRYLNPMPLGAAGELYIGGTTLARGYVGRPAATAERFLPNPFGPPGSRCYRTGDRVRRRSTGALDFLGRFDDQVKIRGYRVEPGEVAAALRDLDGVREAVVVATASDDAMRLVAYVTGEAGLEVAALGQRLGERLPGHMIPSAFVRLDALPMTANGKVDRRALPEPERERPVGEAPRGETEEALAALWRDLLSVDRIGRDDRFAALGGDSILSLKLLARIRKSGLAQGRKLSLADILNAASLAALAALLAPAAPTGPDVVHLRRGGAGLPLFCFPGLVVNSTELAPLAEAAGDRPVEGFVSHVYTERRWQGYDIAALADDYADHILRKVTGGRCALLGWSSGGDLAFETAHRLSGRVDLAFIGLVDVFEPVALHAVPAMTDAARRQAEPSLEAWLGRSPMADRWRRLLDQMDASERDGVLRYVVDRHGDLPLDGPGMTSVEFELWAQVEKQVRARRHRHRPLDSPVHVWHAEKSLGRSEALVDWSRLAPVALIETIAGATHRDIVTAPALHRSVRAALATADGCR